MTWAGAPELDALLARLDRGRAEGAPLASLERQIEQRYGASRRLAVYGSLAPGESNHHVVAPLGGTWRPGWVRGQLLSEGWGSAIGYPGMRWDPAAERVAVRLLSSTGLPSFWARLDAFEGSDYLRILVPVRNAGDELLAVANLYAAR